MFNTYIPTIGLEIHAELKTRTKMFCDCRNDLAEQHPNVNVCPICLAHPGTLPVPNKQAIESVLLTGMALNGDIPATSKFDRKNYFYPDLPKGYQISQYDQPLIMGGILNGVRIRRIHLEEDTGRLLHDTDNIKRESHKSLVISHKSESSLVDFNRAGVPLMELVTEPDIQSAEQAVQFAKELQLVLRYLGVSDADMEKGQMRVEVNISVKKENPSSRGSLGPVGKLGTKVEIKNLNSFRVVGKAIDFEIQRQTEILEKGEKVVQETRGWHDKKEITFSQREKEEAHDYRYFPEPDLPPLYFEKEYVKRVKSEITELPEQKRKRFAKEYGLSENQITTFVNNKDLGEYYEKVISEFEEWLIVEKGKKIAGGKEKREIHNLSANYLISDVLGLLRQKQFTEMEFKITPENFAEFVKMIYKNEISSKVAKMVLKDMFNTGSDPSTIVDENNWRQISDDSELEKIIKETIAKNPKAVADYKVGNKNALQFLTGQVMAATQGTANPQKVRQILDRIL